MLDLLAPPRHTVQVRVNFIRTRDLNYIVHCGRCKNFEHMYKIESTALTLFALCIKRVFLDEYLERVEMMMQPDAQVE